MKEVEIYTDGSCLGNPGRGGYAAILKYGSQTREISGHIPETTNNRAEVLAVICALSYLKEPCHVKLHSDSQYVHQIIKRLADNQKLKKNQDLGHRLKKLINIHRVFFVKVEGHSGHLENERCDFLAKQAAKNKA